MKKGLLYFFRMEKKRCCFLFFFFLYFSSFSQQKTDMAVTGVVLTADNVPLEGVSVHLAGGTIGTTTDIDGRFSLEVPEGAILSISFLGYESRQVKADNANLGNILLVSKKSLLSEVLVIGYGTQKRSDVTGSISSISSKDLEKAVFTTVDEMLQGRAAGVVATSTSGEPGAPLSIRIRGSNSISGNNGPLYVVDGIPMGGASFDPQEVERIEILKDASATAIYGSRGANGVVLITTKKGKPGKTVIELNHNLSRSKVLRTYDMLNGKDYATYRNEASVAAGLAAPFPNVDEYAGKGYNWQDEIFREGWRNNTVLSVSGGKDNVRYYVAGSYLDDQGIILNSYYKRNGLRFSIDADALNDKLNLQFTINTSQTNTNHAISASRGFPNQGGPIVNALMSDPLVSSKLYAGLTAENYQFYNPYLEVTKKQDRQANTFIMANGKATYKITDALTNVFYAGYNYNLNSREIFYPSSVGPGINTKGQATSSSPRSYNYVLGDYLTYQQLFGLHHDFSATAGVEYSSFDNYTFATGVSNFEVESLGLDNVGIATSLNNVGSGRTKSTLQSGFLRLNYAYNSKYLFTVTGRADGSSRFAENRKWGYFPSAAVGWVISKEAFMSEIKPVSHLKARASVGRTGNQSINPYQSLERYNTIVYPIGNVPTLGYVPTGVANPNLKWESTKQTDIGLDLGLFDNKIEVTFDYFDKVTNNLLQPIAIPDQSGFNSALVNFGSIGNRGIELTVSARVLTKNNFSWNTSVNYTSYKNKVIELGGADQIFGPAIGTNLTGAGHIYAPGKEFGIFWGLVATGLIQQSDLDAAAAAGKPLPAYNNDRNLGHWKFKDTNGDGVINIDDREQIGNPNPDFVFGWNNDLTYKNFSLNLFIQGSIGNDVYNTIGTIINDGFLSGQSYNNQTVDWYKNRWTTSNPINDIRYPSINSISPPAANFMVEDGSYIRLKNISLRYNIPVKKSVVSSLQVYVTATNLFTITKYTGFDPEVSMLGANTLGPGVDLGAYPRQSITTFGVNIKL